VKTALNWQDLRSLGTTGAGGGWHPNEDIAEYFKNLRTPSRAWPHSYARAAQTYKFKDWLLQNKPEIAQRFFKEDEDEPEVHI
jgi:hypothetical protein